VPQRKKLSTKSSQPQWKRMDLHLHTPASADYRESNVTYLDILKKAEQKGLDIIAITDHNTAAGFRRYTEEVEDLELLERRNRLTEEEKDQLKEWRRLKEKIVVLPGFELTATLGFHVLGIFPPETTVRELEHLLLDLNVPTEKLDVGSGEVGATTDVLTAYRLINEAGGLAIAAHANSSHGVAMPGFDFGGQTRIAYTQDENLHALEVTDLASKSRRRTQLFFSGTKPEYPRKMHCIQGSDAHRLNGIAGNNQELGVGDRPTEILLPEATFEAIMEVLTGRDFSKTRPFVPAATHEFDPIFTAREEGDTLVQAFHESVGKHGIDRRILQDVVALANTNGGTIYIGASANLRQPVAGVTKPFETGSHLRAEISKHIVPPIDVQVDTLKSGGKQVLQMIVPRGTEVPYALDSTQIFVRSENETSLAVRDEIVNLVRDSLAVEFAARVENAPLKVVQAVEQAAAIVEAQPSDTTKPETDEKPGATDTAPRMPSAPPHTGVEIVSSKSRARGNNQYTMRDLRNNRIIHNVTRSSARKLWQYAIAEHDRNTAAKADVKWLGDVGIVKASERAGKLRYDLVQRDSNGDLHVYYGVTDDGIHGVWKDLIETLSGQTPVEQLTDEEENGTVAVPEVFTSNPDVPALEISDVRAAAHDFLSDDAAIPVAEGDGNKSVSASDAESEEVQLITEPGRNQYPPVVSDLTPSTSETDDIPAVPAVASEMAHPAVQASAMTAVTDDLSEQPAAAQQVADFPAPTAYDRAQRPEAAAESSELKLPHNEQEAIGAAVAEAAVQQTETPILENEGDAIMAASMLPELSDAAEPAPMFKNRRVEFTSATAEMPDPIQVIQAPVDSAPTVPVTIISGDPLAPIVPSPGKEVRDNAPDVNVNFDDQIVLPPK
jgi:PHP family Zn ribbon phosphoesterase